MKSMRRQQGLTFISWMLLGVMVGVIAISAIKIAPIYMENYSVKGILKGLDGDPELETKSPMEIGELIQRRLNVNGIEIGRDKVKITKTPNDVAIDIQYEDERKMAGNLFVKAYFHERLEKRF